VFDAVGPKTFRIFSSQQQNPGAGSGGQQTGVHAGHQVISDGMNGAGDGFKQQVTNILDKIIFVFKSWIKMVHSFFVPVHS
jgi:hypothetical protein